MLNVLSSEGRIISILSGRFAENMSGLHVLRQALGRAGFSSHCRLQLLLDDDD